MEAKDSKNKSHTVAKPTAVIPTTTNSNNKDTNQQAVKAQTAFHAGQILYAQPSDHQRGTTAKVVINTGQQRISLNQGQALELDNNHWLLVDVQPLPDSNQMSVMIRLNGQARQVRYPAL